MQRLFLSTHMHQVAAHDTIGVHHQIIEGLLLSWSTRNGGNTISFISNRNQARISLNLLL